MESMHHEEYAGDGLETTSNATSLTPLRLGIRRWFSKGPSSRVFLKLYTGNGRSASDASVAVSIVVPHSGEWRWQPLEVSRQDVQSKWAEVISSLNLCFSGVVGHLP